MVLVVIAAFDDLALRRVGGSGALSADFEAKSSAIFRQRAIPSPHLAAGFLLPGISFPTRLSLFGATP
jgi:hypothetical protein